MKKPALSEKNILTPEECIEHFHFSRRKWYKFLKDGKCKDFTALYRGRRLILRAEFEKFLNGNREVKETLANGEPRREKKGFQA